MLSPNLSQHLLLSKSVNTRRTSSQRPPLQDRACFHFEIRKPLFCGMFRTLVQTRMTPPIVQLRRLPISVVFSILSPPSASSAISKPVLLSPANCLPPVVCCSAVSVSEFWSIYRLTGFVPYQNAPYQSLPLKRNFGSLPPQFPTGYPTPGNWDLFLKCSSYNHPAFQTRYDVDFGIDNDVPWDYSLNPSPDYDRVVLPWSAMLPPQQYTPMYPWNFPPGLEVRLLYRELNPDPSKGWAHRRAL